MLIWIIDGILSFGFNHRLPKKREKPLPTMDSVLQKQLFSLVKVKIN